MLAAVPAALRVGGHGGSAALGWLLLAGGGALVAGPVVALARAARPALAALWSVFAAVAVVAIPLSVFARLLHQTTHHRPLGAATFVMVALVLLCLTSFAAWRALVWLQASSHRPRWISVSILGVTGLVVLLLLGQLGLTSEWRASVLDATALSTLGVAAVALQPSAPWQARLRRVAVPAWATLVVLALWLSRGAVGPVVGEAAPVLSPLNGW